VAATCHLILVYTLGYTLFPAYDESLSRDLLTFHSIINNTIAFFVSNTVAYLLNVRFVFTSGRHKRHTEIFLFFLASSLSYFPALFTIPLIIKNLELNPHLANIGFMGTAAAFNFIIRKLLIFKN